MAEIPIYEGDKVTLRWGRLTHACTVHKHNTVCVLCVGTVVRIDPPWETWELLCLAESALVVKAHERHLAAGAIGQVVSLPVHIEKEVRQ